ncbi:S-adenosyl-L-methionine-dependent methyltransferase [Aspergillus pseudoustus]|uniref:S-adenosyl-L-methionine-dependent methyltransferase n=1 Tax=Aspergillus pseudoustus TaxID=1810923 RepID=A0ABR4JI85_9EURO
MTGIPTPNEAPIDIQKLVAVGNLIQNSIQAVVDEATKQRPRASSIPSWPIYEAQRTIISATGALLELVSDPSMRLMEFSGQYWESRALAIAVAKRIPDLVGSSEQGVCLEEIAAKTGIEIGKLGRVLRCLCSAHIFQETRPDTFTNNRISSALVGNESLRAYILMFHADLFSCAEHLPQTLFDADWGHSYDVRKTAFQRALATTQSRWEWLEGGGAVPGKVDTAATALRRTNYPGIPGEEDGTKQSTGPRPELALFSMAMVGGGRVTARSHVEDYPWHELGHETVVDIGGGVGGFMLELSQKYPQLNLVVQDCESNIELAKTKVWPAEGHAALEHGRVKFFAYDFFTPNPVNGAAVYWLRYILHDWADEYCLNILTNIRQAMGPHSRLLVCEQVMDTTVQALTGTAPAPLPANYGVAKRYSHQRDLDVMAIINGIERTPAQFADLFDRAGLVLRKVWPCRSQVSILEVHRKV